MSLGYAEKLSYKEDVGTVGMSEIFDSPVVLQQKVCSSGKFHRLACVSTPPLVFPVPLFQFILLLAVFLNRLSFLFVSAVASGEGNDEELP